MADQESNRDVDQYLKWLNADRLDQRLLGLARELDYNLYVLTAPSALDGEKGSDQVDGLVRAVVAHCELLARSAGPLVGDGGAHAKRSEVGLLVASRESEESLGELLSQFDGRIVSTIPYEAVCDLQGAPRLPALKDAPTPAAKQVSSVSPDTDLTEGQAEKASRGTFNFAYRFKENSLRTIDRALGALGRFMADPDNRQALQGVLRSIQKLKGLGTMFGLQGVAKLAYALEWSLETALKSDENLDEASVDAIQRSIAMLPGLVTKSDRGETSVDEIDTHIEKLRGLFEPFASRELRLDAPEQNALEAELDLDPAFLESASAFERRLLLDAVERGKKCYIVSIRPSEGILKTGLEPLDLYGMLEVAGDVLLNLPILEEVPDITEYDVNKYYFRFKFLIASDYSPNELEDILATFYEIGEIEFKSCNRFEAARSPASLNDSWTEETRTRGGPMIPEPPRHEVSEAAIADLTGRVEQVSQFAHIIAGLMHNGRELPDRMGGMFHDFIRHVGGLRDVMSELRSKPLSNLIEEVPRAIRETARQRRNVYSVRVEPLEAMIDADLLDGISDPIIDLCLSFMPKAGETVPSGNGEITVSGQETDHLVTLLITGKKCRARLHNSPLNAILQQLEKILLANFGLVDATFEGDALTSCRLRFPTSPSNITVRELHVADRVLGVPHSLILDVAGSDAPWPEPFLTSERQSPFVRFRTGTNGGPAIVASATEKAPEGATVVRLGHGFARLSLLVDGLGDKRQAISIRHEPSSNEAPPAPLLSETTLDNGQLVPLIDPASLARHLKLDHGMAELADLAQ